MLIDRHTSRRRVQPFRLHRSILFIADLPHQLHRKLMRGRHLVRQHFLEVVNNYKLTSKLAVTIQMLAMDRIVKTALTWITATQ